MINRIDLYKEVSAETGFAASNINEVMNAVAAKMIEHLKNNEEVRLFEGVTFVPTYTEEKMKFVPLVQEERVIPAHYGIKAKFTPAFKRKLND